jgi:chromosome segregation ATPase
VVEVAGRGRGKGVQFVSRSSVLDDPEIVVPIRKRCLQLIRIIDRQLPSTKEDIVNLKRDLQRWKKSALDIQSKRNDQEAQLVEMESNMFHWKRETENFERRNRDLEAKIADDESTIRRWTNHSKKLSMQVQDLTLENDQLTRKIESLKEEKESAMEEMDEILEIINSSANEDFVFLIDAVSYLLEMG